MTSLKSVIAATLTVVLVATSASAIAGPGGGDRGNVDRQSQQADRGRVDHRGPQQDRGRQEAPAQDQDRDQDRDQGRVHAPDFAQLSDHDIYGSDVMSTSERNEYRDRMRVAESAEAQERIRAEHREIVQARAKSQGVKLGPASEGPIYGQAMMNVQERNLYREKMRMLDSDAERGQFVAQHREQMQARAKAQGVPFEQLSEIEEAE